MISILPGRFEHEGETIYFEVSGDGDPVVFSHGLGGNHASWFQQVGPFSERRRGSDTLFVRRVVEALSPDAVRFLPELHVDHLEIATVRDYYRKLYVYGRSFRRFAPLGRVRPLTTRERLGVWRATVESRPPRDAAALLGVLALGVLFWWAGSLSGLVREAT